MSPLCVCRYEVLPFRSSEEQAPEIAAPIRLMVTASPKHGIDRSVAYGERLRALGHGVLLHLAGFHVFTFDELAATWRWQHDH